MDQSSFFSRHVGLSEVDQGKMLDLLGISQMEDFISSVVPANILDKTNNSQYLQDSCDEKKALEEIALIANENRASRSLIGLGYYGTSLPALVKRHILENPCWYTAYTPYQAEISQGRLEALFHFQTLISELTGLPIANASLLDEATAAAEAMSLSYVVNKKSQAKRFLVDKEVLPQTLAVLTTRAKPLGIILEVIDPQKFNLNKDVFGLLLQLPGKNGHLWDPTEVIAKVHEIGGLATVSIDPLAQVLIEPVASFGADIAVGSAQRFGVPMGYGGPHAAFFATKEVFKRQVPGRLVGQSIDNEGQQALRLALQTREQHIRRDKATSNICTAQVLLAVLAVFYAIYHGPSGLKLIAQRIVELRLKLESYLEELGYPFQKIDRFDTVEVYCSKAPQVHQLAYSKGFNLRILPLGSSIKNAKGFGITFDELTTEDELLRLHEILADACGKKILKQSINPDINSYLMKDIPLRKSDWLEQPVFNIYRNETELLRYINRLVTRDFSLVHGMIPLGSCTMKLNGTAELLPISWKQFADIHPFAPKDQAQGYKQLISDLSNWLGDLTGFQGVSLQPNAGSQGEFAGLLVIQAWHQSRGESHRNVCLIPTSAHGTNPASAVMAGLKVVPISCDQKGNVDIEDLKNKAADYSDKLSSLMVTYPSTHGVFEPQIREICEIVHKNGGQVYLDGANLNAQVGLCRPGSYGADVCHLNLHKTFCIPHGGGGPGVGPIAVAAHLTPFLPSHPLLDCGGHSAIGPVSSAPYGSACILPISWMYIRMMGAENLRKASSIAMLSANYIAKRLEPYYSVLFKGVNGLVAHECILDLRPIKDSTGIEVDDIAKRLMDYGFHAPTVSWPVAGTLMVEPTESESLIELNRFCDAMIAIRLEIQEIELGISDRKNNPLSRAPHTLKTVTADKWDRPYSRTTAAFPMEDQFKTKFWPSVSRIDNAFGDRNLVCSCASLEDLSNN
ncbi:aminomethyl-transferring glycine dehydrogenase [Prochlorococcus sp. MIT 1223]|uniref:aminomethyl-transferring glycine dehydrogenase n=1 Tax=Prochlorococcus sp. MIT 1223 TaxID=3096217 RepID=UPI002A7478DD|nr:aminomethyl-transferring glycine dehydrogenase [Prochlorococcus sp. MIT 1223]